MVETILRKSILSESQVEYPVQEPFTQITPYLGCGHDCPFCYACRQALWRGRIKKKEDWPNARPIINAPILLEKDLRKRQNKGKLPGTLMISFWTDCYQELEREYQITRQCLQVLKKYPEIRVMILTKSDLVVRDLDVLREMNVEVGFTIISTQPITTTTPHPMHLVIALAQLKTAGIKTFCSIEPILKETRILNIFQWTKDYVDKYYLGCLNYYKLPQRNYPALVRMFQRLAASERKEVIIKKELKKLI